MREMLKEIGRLLFVMVAVVGGTILVLAILIGLLVLAGGSSAGY